MNKITIDELRSNKNWSEAVVVFTQDSFTKQFTEEERSYRVFSDAKYFDSTKIGKSLFGDCLDGVDKGVRLDIYMQLMPDEGKRWIVDYCYILK